MEPLAEQPGIQSHKKNIKHDTLLIKSAVDKYGVDTMIEDKSFDLLCDMVYNRIEGKTKERIHILPQNDIQRKSEQSFFKSLLNSLIISFIVYLIISSSRILFTEPQTTSQTDSFSCSIETLKEDSKTGRIGFNSLPSRVIRCGQFEFQRGNCVVLKNYAGRDQMVLHVETMIKKFVTQIKKLKKEELDNISAYNRQNFLMKGPPGTGKTIFVRYIATLVDRFLKLKQYKKEHPDKYRELVSNNQDLDSALETEPSRVLFCEVTPSSINDKYVGESEKNVKALFNAAEKLSKIENFAVFLFFDEGDVFFESRSSAKSESNSSSFVKSELLQRIGVQPKEYHPLFIFCATNRVDVFDEAFSRRFGMPLDFGLPDYKERLEFAKYLLKDFEVDEKSLETIALLSQGKSQSDMKDRMRNFYIEDELGICSGFNLRQYIERLYFEKNGNKKSE